MTVPEVLSIRELRSGLAGVIRRVGEPGAEPVFVGSHRKAEAVLLSVEEYQQMRAEVTRRGAVAEALASVRAEGLEPSDAGLARFAAVADGRLTPAEAVDQALGPYRK